MAEKKIDVVLMKDAVEMIKEEKQISYNEGFADGYKQAIREVNKQLEQYHKADSFLEAYGWKWEEGEHGTDC